MFKVKTVTEVAVIAKEGKSRVGWRRSHDRASRYGNHHALRPSALMHALFANAARGDRRVVVVVERYSLQELVRDRILNDGVRATLDLIGLRP